MKMARVLSPRLVLAVIAAVLATAAFAGPAVAGKNPINTTFFGGIAIKGYDPVAYFTDGRPVKGDKAFEHKWMGAKWRFASPANRDAFAANPNAYAPQYGGYCAYAVAQSTTADVDPEAWKIVDGKLYLNLSKEIQELWEKDIPGYITRADKNWPGVLGQ